MMRGRGLVAAGVAAVVLFGAAACGGRSVPVASARSFASASSAAVSRPAAPADPVASESCPDAMADGVWYRLALSQYGEDDDGDGRPDEVVLPAHTTWCDALKTASMPSVDDLAAMVLRGVFGDGAERRTWLGAEYDAVQQRVDALMPAPVVAAPAAAPVAAPAPAAPAKPAYADAPACAEEDGSGQAGVCVWDSHTMGNRQGHGIFLYRGGALIGQWD